MMKHTLLVAVATFLLSLHAFAALAREQPDSSKPFPVAHVRFEQNATDGDVEVVFEVTGRSEGLSKLKVHSPDGRTIVDFNAPDASTMGIRQFVFESPEPKDVAGLKSAYPEGTYTFTGLTAAGAQLQGKATLHHTLPATTSIISPKSDAHDVAVKNPKITWKPVRGMIAYIVELEQEGTDASITAKLPASTNSFSVPNGFLQPGTEYKLGIGTLGDDGNISYVETSFTTADAQ